VGLEPHLSIHFTKGSKSERYYSGYYGPVKLFLLKRVFENACKEATIIDKDLRDTLAGQLLMAARAFEDEPNLVEFMQKAIADV
jgi:hypothetical protein